MKKQFLILLFITAIPVLAQSRDLYSMETAGAPQTIDLLKIRLFKPKTIYRLKKLALAREALDQGRFLQARKLAQPLLHDSWFADYALSFTAESLRQEAQAYLKSHRFKDVKSPVARSIALCQDIEKRQPYSPLIKRLPEDIAAAEILTAQAYAGVHEWHQCEEFFERGFQRLSVQGALGLLTPAELETYADACSKSPGPLCVPWLQKFVSFYPKNSREIAAIEGQVPDLPERERVSYAVSRPIQTYKVADPDQVAIDAALALYLDDQTGGAIKAFQKFQDEFPKSAHRYRARYWLGQALLKDKDSDRAQKTFDELSKETPLSYYGLLAQLAQNKSLPPAFETVTPVGLASDPQLSPLEVVRLERAERLIAEGAPLLAGAELRDIRPRDSLSSPFLVYLAMLDAESGNHAAGFPVLSELIQRGYEGMYSSYGLGLIFPVVYFDLIEKYSRANNIDPILVLSLMKQESAFETKAASGSAAMGLMQLIHPTALDMDSAVIRTDLFSPETSIRIGTQYIRHLLTRSSGNIAISLASYNAGPTAVDRWLKDPKARRGVTEFIETIPYKETREYVASIIRNYYWYSSRIRGEMPKGLDFFWTLASPSPVPSTK